MAQFPFYKQETDYTCGAAAMRMALEFCNIKKTEKQVAKLLETNKTRGTLDKNFPAVAEKFGLSHISMKNSTINDLKEYQKKGYAIIVCYFNPSEKSYHYSVLKKIGIKYIYFWDPFYGEKHRYLLSEFKRNWKSDPKYDREKQWFFGVKR